VNPLPSLSTAVARWIPSSRVARKLWLATFIVSIILLLLPFVIHLDGKPHAGWEQLLGRFHILALHIPIGLLLLVPVLEIAGTSRPALREAAGFVLVLGSAACLITLALGFLLAHGSGETGATVTLHMWGAVALSILLLFTLLVRQSVTQDMVSRAYPILLSCSLLALVFTAHQGGTLTHGGNYLTQYLPAPLRKALTFGSTGAALATDSFYAKHVDPIFDSRCVSCHGSGKTQGGLRLDSYAALMQGGHDGEVIVAGNPEKSILFQRITLPASDKHFMPAEGKPPLQPQEIAWIRAWIQQGASPSTTTLAGISTPEPTKDLPLKPVPDYSALIPEIRAMQQNLGAKLVPVSGKPSDGLVLSTVDVAQSFGDAQLAQFQKFAPYIVEAELGRTAVTDASFDTLAKFTNLRTLHLEGTAVTGANIQKLAGLSQLAYLNLSNTQVTQAALAPLHAMKNLHHIYVFNTPAQPAHDADGQKAGSTP
jgi:mono/diheme cytochrome c family protein